MAYPDSSSYSCLPHSENEYNFYYALQPASEALYLPASLTVHGFRDHHAALSMTELPDQSAYDNSNVAQGLCPSTDLFLSSTSLASHYTTPIDTAAANASYAAPNSSPKTADITAEHPPYFIADQEASSPSLSIAMPLVSSPVC